MHLIIRTFKVAFALTILCVIISAAGRPEKIDKRLYVVLNDQGDEECIAGDEK